MLLVNESIIAQTISCQSTPFNCSLDLRNEIFTNTKIKSTTNNVVVYGKSGTDYTDAEFDSTNSDFDNCGINNTCRTDYQNVLYYYMSYPKITEHDYASCPLPVVIIFHPGGFSDCNNLANDNPHMYQLSRDLAKRGYISIVAEYRRGVIDDKSQVFPNNPDPFIQRITYTGAPETAAIYRGVQDCAGVIRSFIKRQRTGSDEFKADTNNIFLAGASAGAVMVTLTAYYTQSMINDVSENIKDALGVRNIDFYSGDTHIEYKSKIKGVLSMWGNAFLPLANINNPVNFFAQNSNSVPMIAFHGYYDPITPIYYEPVYYSAATGASAPFHTITNCLLPNVSSFSVSPTGVVSGSLKEDQYRGGPLYYYENIFNQTNTPPMELYVDCEMEHGMDSDCSSCMFDSEFGTGATNINDVFTYMAQRTAIFFQAILGGYVNQIDRRIFFNCENYRYGCNPADYHENCPPNTCE